VGAQKANGCGGGGGRSNWWWRSVVVVVRRCATVTTTSTREKGESLGRVACVYTCAGCPVSDSGGGGGTPAARWGSTERGGRGVYAHAKTFLYNCCAARTARRYNINNNIMVRRAFGGFHPTTGYLRGTTILQPPSLTRAAVGR